MNLTASIESAEGKFKQVLEDFFVSIYNENNLSSHGIEHHRRVWNYAKELLSIQFRQYNSEPACNPSNLIIACYLHDIGMFVEPGPRHGKHSRELCRQFFEKNNLDENDYKDVLDTIENHDIKDYSAEMNRNDLLTVLSVADDLDAFGFSGIYRYSEIYLTRGVNPFKIGYLILQNAEKRFKNFEKILGAHSYYVQKHGKRFEILNNFFTQYNKQVDSYDFRRGNPEGYCGIIQLFILLVRNELALTDLYNKVEFYQNDIIIESFLKGLKSELSSKDNYE
jgi:hypothetical protein